MSRNAARYVPPSTLRVLAATLGVVPASVLAAAAIARFAPFSAATSFALGYALWIPLWLAASLVVSRISRPAPAWAVVGGVTLVLVLALFAVPH